MGEALPVDVRQGMCSSRTCRDYKGFSNLLTESALVESSRGQHPDLSPVSNAGESLHGGQEEQGRPVDGASVLECGEVGLVVSLLLQAEEEPWGRYVVRVRGSEGDSPLRRDEYSPETAGHGRGVSCRCAVIWFN